VEDADRMKLPVGTKTDVEREKISDYLLNPAHPENGGKAAFFERMFLGHLFVND
jgi:hypothetical protein